MGWWVKNDGCGVFCGLFTPTITAYAWLVQFTFVIGPYFGYTSPLMAFYTIITVLAMTSHARAQFTNPGAVPLDNPDAPPASLNDSANNGDVESQQLLRSHSKSGLEVRRCTRCRIDKPLGAHHCSVCKRCIIKMDHHCPWVNNCVAFFNQKYFILFLSYTAMLCLMCGMLLIWRFIHCSTFDNDDSNDHNTSPASNRRRRRRRRHRSRHQSGSNTRLLLSDLGFSSESGVVSDGGAVDSASLLSNGDSSGGINTSTDTKSGSLSVVLNNDDNSSHSELMSELDQRYCEAGPGDVVCCIVNMFEAILFGLFTTIMSCDQISSIMSGQTYIDTIQARRRRKSKQDLRTDLEMDAKERRKARDNAFETVFGEPFGIGWFLPKALTPQILKDFDLLCQKFYD